MPSPLPPQSRVSNLLLAIRPERLIALGRLTFATFAILAIHLDPTRQPSVIHDIVWAYLLFAAVVLVISLRKEIGGAGQLAQHAVDIATVGALMHLTEGQTSPFFVLFTFPLFAASLRWDWRGILGTASVLFLVLVLVAMIETAVFGVGRLDLMWLIMKAAYFAVVGVLLMYFSAFRERSRHRLAKLALWPPEEEPTGDSPRLLRCLAHAADVLQAGRVLVIWQNEQEPWLRAVQWTDKGFEYSEEIPHDWSELVSPKLDALCFAASDPRAEWVRLATGWQSASQAPLGEALAEMFSVEGFVTAPFHGRHSRGRVFILGPLHSTEGLLALTEIVAARVRIEIDQFQYERELAAAERTQERARVARDMHDGILQDLTAADLKLKALGEMAPADVRQGLTEVSELLHQPHDRIRNFVNATVQNASPSSPVTTAEIARLTDKLSQQWGCEISVYFDPQELELPNGIVYQLSLLLAEATANAVQHGQASAIRVAMSLSGNSLALLVHDNGKGVAAVRPSADGANAQSETVSTRSLQQRVSDLGGYMTAASSAAGVELTMTIPLRP